jgi:hypothetical protein
LPSIQAPVRPGSGSSALVALTRRLRATAAAYVAWNASVARSRSADAIRCSATPGPGAGRKKVLFKLIVKLAFCDAGVASDLLVQ